MSSRPAAEELVARIDHEVDGIDGLITVLAVGEDVVALTVSRPEVRRVREALVRLGIPQGRLVVQAIDEVLIPHPATDPRLERWMEHAREGSAMASREKTSELRMTPGGIGKLVVGGAALLYLLSMMIFLLLMMVQRWMT